jgi:hypothetical protein
MPLSSATYTGNGSLKQFAVPFLYIEKSDVTATVGGTPTSFTWVDDATIQFAAAPGNGVAVKIIRATDVSNLAVDFTDGSNIVEVDLDTAYRHTLFYTQELKEKFDFYISYWNSQVISGGDLPTSSAANDFLAGDGGGGWDVKTLAETKTILGIDELEASNLTLPEPTGVAGVLSTDGVSWSITGIRPTRDLLNLGQCAIHDIDDLFDSSITLPATAGTAAGNLVKLDGSAKLPAVDGSQLTNINHEKYALVREKAAYNVNGGALTGANAWQDRSVTDEIVDADGLVTLGTGTVKVTAVGTYRFRVRTKLRVVGSLLMRVKVEGGSVIATGSAVYNAAGEVWIELPFQATFVGTNTELRVQVYSTGAGSGTTDLGTAHGASGLGDNIYTEFEIWKLPS